MQTSADNLKLEVAQRLSALHQRLARRPTDATLHNEIGVALAASERLHEALLAFERATEFCPGFAEAWFNRGLVLSILDRRNEAFDALQRACELAPNYHAAREKLGEIARQVGRRAKNDHWAAKSRLSLRTLFARRTAISTVPDWNSDADDAEQQFRAALAGNRSDAAVLIAFGRWLWRKERFIEAELFLKFALALQPRDGTASLVLADILQRTHRPEDAMSVLEGVPTGDSYDTAILFELLRLHLVTCAWDGFDELLQRALSAIATEPSSCSPYLALLLPTTLEQQQGCAAAAATKVAAGKVPLAKSAITKRPQIIKIGYLSADFHQHAVATLIAELPELHDRRRFHVKGYALWLDDRSAYRKRFRKGFDEFVDLYRVSSLAAARHIRDQGIDILVDLNGYTQNGRPEILAYRPARVQVNFLGYPGTLGGDFADYIIADSTVAPIEHQPWYAERLVHMPDAYQINDRRRPQPPKLGSRREYGLPEAAIVFCNFSDATRITPSVFDVWMRILRRAPTGVLWLLADSARVRDNLRREASRRDVPPERLVFAGSAPYEEHISRYWHADLFLDTLPYNAHTSCSEALWMGCPVVTCIGQTFAGRVAASLLRAVNAPELIAATIENYEETAVRLGACGAELRSIRNRMRDNRKRCALFDSVAYVRALECAYMTMIDRYVAGEAPAPITVPRPLGA
jgi:predicted O-linked N-acetylglucosamine transferase (SPINDLY family)